LRIFEYEHECESESETNLTDVRTAYILINRISRRDRGANVCHGVCMASEINFYSELVISTIRIADISNSNCWYQQFELLISTIVC